MKQYRVDQILSHVRHWEKRLVKLFESLRDDGQDNQQLEFAFVHQLKIVDALNRVDFESYKNVEFLRYIPEFHQVEIVPPAAFSSEHSNEQLTLFVVETENKLCDYYRHLRNVLAHTRLKELFDMLIEWKMAQLQLLKLSNESLHLVK